MLLYLPSIGEEVDFDVRVSGSPVFPGRQVFGAQYGDDQLMAHFVIPQFDLRGQCRAEQRTERALGGVHGRRTNTQEGVTQEKKLECLLLN